MNPGLRSGLLHYIATNGVSCRVNSQSAGAIMGFVTRGCVKIDENARSLEFL